jgi:prepilin signal peptidase PulO-like enzyme (type II secretory pathway)
MGSIFIFYTSIVALVFALPGMIVGGVVGGASLMALGVFNGILEFGLAMDWWAGKLPAVCALLGVALGVVLAIRYSIHNCGSSAIGEQSIELVE